MAQPFKLTAYTAEADRKLFNRWQVSLGSPAPTTSISWSDGTDNKLLATVAPSAPPIGFDMFTTASDGPAIRFIGSGLGNGDTANFIINAAFSIEVGTGSGQCVFKAKTRPYTETVFSNADDINYVGMSRNFPNNDLGALPITPQIITLSDGDLVEFSANPANAFSNVSLPWSGITIIEV